MSPKNTLKSFKVNYSFITISQTVHISSNLALDFEQSRLNKETSSEKTSDYNCSF